MTGQESVQHHEFAPPQPLRSFVRRFLHSCSDGAVHYSTAAPPTGSCYLTHVYGAPMRLRFRDGRGRWCPQLFIGGQLSREMPVGEISGEVGLVGVELRPTALYRLFGRDCRMLTDTMTDAREFLPDGGGELVDSLLAGAGISNKIAIMSRFLCRFVASAAEPSKVDKAIARIEAEAGIVTVEQLAGECGWSTRHLHRRFLTEVGIGPKLYAKIVQVNHVAAAIQTGEKARLNDIAHDCGYYDQAQFVRDFQRLVGVNPMSFLYNPDPFLHIYLGRKGLF